MTTTRAAMASLAVFGILFVPMPAGADPRPIHPYRLQTGQRVRLWTADEVGGLQSTNATVTAVDRTGLAVVIKDRTELIPFADLERMEVRRGWRNLRRFALVGLVVGAAAGVLAEDGGDEWDKVRAGAIGAGVGAAVGTVTAGAIWPARWVPVDIEQIRPPPVADKGALRLSFTLSF